MTKALDPMTKRLHELREEFDHSFSLPFAQPAPASREDMLCFTAAAKRFAIPLVCLQELVKAGEVVAVPSHARGLLGVTIVRAAIMPVFSMSSLMGGDRGPSQPTWLAILRGAAPVALAIEALDGCVRPPKILQAAEGSAPRFVNGSIEHHSQSYAILDCGSLYAAIVHL